MSNKQIFESTKLLLSFAFLLFFFDPCFAHLNPKGKPLVDEFEKTVSHAFSAGKPSCRYIHDAIKDNRIIALNAFSFANSKEDKLADTIIIYRIVLLPNFYVRTLDAVGTGGENKAG